MNDFPLHVGWISYHTDYMNDFPLYGMSCVLAYCSLRWNTYLNNYMNDFSPLCELSHGLEPGALCGPRDLKIVIEIIIRYFTY